MNVFIFLNGNPSSVNFYKGHYETLQHDRDTVVCADGGYRLAQQLGVKPDFIIGDLDSLQNIRIEEGIEVRRYPRNKDLSDFELALQATFEMEPEKVYVYGALGGRIDHELANILLLGSSKHQVVFIEEEVEIYGAHECLVLNNRKGFLCSLLTLGSPCHVKEMQGFQYILHDEMLHPSSRGLSNIITEDAASISLHSGSLIVVVSTTEETFLS
jgi:thiamine pyrophosphokinase